MRAALVAALVLLVVPAYAHEQRPPEARLQHMIRAARADRGLVGWHGDRLHRFGRRQVTRMIDCRCVKHAQPPLFCRDWGQAVGIGQTVGAIFRAFLASPAHRRIILDPRFDRIGVGARRVGGLVYVAVELCG